MRHPTATADLAYDVTDIRYDDSFDDAASADELVEIFERLANEVASYTPVLPVDTESGNPAADGYVMFTDQLGDFMHVTDLTRITYCTLLPGDPDQTDCDPQEFGDPTVTDLGGGVSRYTFHGTYQANDPFDATDVSNIVITVQTFPSLAVGDLVTVRIPVALLPMRDTRIVEDIDGTPLSMTWYASHPVHVYYNVAPKPGVAAAISDPQTLDAIGQPGDGGALAAYLADNTVDG